MQRNPQGPSAKSEPSAADDEEVKGSVRVENRTRRSPVVWLTLFVLIIYSSYAVYQYQFESMPLPLTAEQAGKRGFSEVEALKHVKALTQLGPHPVGSNALNLALQVFAPKLCFAHCTCLRFL